jgi:hypothetical protein
MMRVALTNQALTVFICLSFCAVRLPCVSGGACKLRVGLATLGFNLEA